MEQFQIFYESKKSAGTATVVAPTESDAKVTLKNALHSDGHRKIRVLLIEPQGVVSGYHISTVKSEEI